MVTVPPAMPVAKPPPPPRPPGFEMEAMFALEVVQTVPAAPVTLVDVPSLKMALAVNGWVPATAMTGLVCGVTCSPTKVTAAFTVRVAEAVMP